MRRRFIQGVCRKNEEDSSCETYPNNLINSIQVIHKVTQFLKYFYVEEMQIHILTCQIDFRLILESKKYLLFYKANASYVKAIRDSCRFFEIGFFLPSRDTFPPLTDNWSIYNVIYDL